MHLKKTLIFFAVAAVLLGYFFIFENPRHKNEALREQQLRRLVEFYPSDVYSVRVERPGLTLEFSRDGDYWFMHKPFAEQADRAAVNVLINAVTGAEIERDLGDSQDLSTYGLDRPAAEIIMANAAGDTLAALSVGNHTIDKAFVYGLARPGGSVLLLPTGIRRYALPDPSEFRDKRVLDFQLDEVADFTITTRRGSMSWRQTPESEWTTWWDGAVVKGHKADVESVLRRLRGLRAASFVSTDEAARLGLFKPPAGSVTIKKIGGDPDVTLVAGKRYQEGVCARVEGSDRIAVTDTALLDIFGKTVYDLRDRRLLRFDKADVTRIELVSPGVRMTVVRPGRDWVFPNPSLGTIDQEAAARLLSGLARLEFTRAVDDDPDEESRAVYLSDVEIRVTVFGEDGSEIDEMVCARARSGESFYYTSSRSSEIISMIENGGIDELIQSFENLRHK